MFWALFFFGVLPVFYNTYGAMETVPPEVAGAARGVRLSPSQIFLQVTLPLALPGILSGVRSSLIINFGTATIGATMGVGGRAGRSSLESASSTTPPLHREP